MANGEFTPELNKQILDALTKRIREQTGREQTGARGRASRRGLAGSTFEAARVSQIGKAGLESEVQAALQFAVENANRQRQERLIQEERTAREAESLRGREFVAGESALDREARLAETESGQLFTAGQAKLGREFTGSQGELARRFAEEQNDAAREFAALEQEKTRAFQTGQTQLIADIERRQTLLQQQFQKRQATLGRTFSLTQGRENLGTQLQFQAGQAQLSREQQERLFGRTQEQERELLGQRFSFESDQARKSREFAEKTGTTQRLFESEEAKRRRASEERRAREEAQARGRSDLFGAGAEILTSFF